MTYEPLLPPTEAQRAAHYRSYGCSHDAQQVKQQLGIYRHDYGQLKTEAAQTLVVLTACLFESQE